MQAYWDTSARLRRCRPKHNSFFLNRTDMLWESGICGVQSLARKKGPKVVAGCFPQICPEG